MNNVQHNKIPKEYQHIPFKWIVENGADRRSIISHSHGDLLYQVSTKEIYISLYNDFVVLGIGYPKQDGKMYLFLNNEWVRMEDHLYSDDEPILAICNDLGTRSIKDTMLYSYDYDISYRPKQCVNLPKLVNKDIALVNENDVMIIEPIIRNGLFIGSTKITENVIYLESDNIIIDNPIYDANKFKLNPPVIESHSESTNNLFIVNDLGYEITLNSYNGDIVLKNKESFMIVIDTKDSDWWHYNHGICSLPRYWSPELV